ncbi:uncharacterized protein BX664DRAFT_30590 [Halteromyces radiatus]|uniref:uncharacterized protein n=1 Tax=Halteromyces radiatus TaxID=101107 RepID=UPI00221ECF29|nr:uncharacterized protein BX664DRAFT_30590 [Halteromyces radiatus]KAI8099949.1 hypothetical protein BX664DRAFT_30590 [Halteromyces radiatus]
MTHERQNLLFDISQQDNNDSTSSSSSSRQHSVELRRTATISSSPIKPQSEEPSSEDHHTDNNITQEAYSYSHTATTEYMQLDVDDSETTTPFRQSQHRPLLLDNEDDDDDSINSLEESKFYRLPSDGGTIFASFLNMANSIIGAGIIGIPYSIKEAVSVKNDLIRTEDIYIYIYIYIKKGEDQIS